MASARGRACGLTRPYMLWRAGSSPEIAE